MAEYCRIIIQGRLDPLWSDWFAGLTLTHPNNDETMLSGVLPDQAALYGLLERIRDLNLRLVALTCRDSLVGPIEESG